ncbi:MAG: beta-hydroxyacyl-ACP dehydratase [Candidatus Omnitrophota bacterium]
MRWKLLDRFDVLKKHSHARAGVRLTGREDFFEDHFPGKSVVPQTLMLEMIAQTGGVLYGLDIDFEREVILVKIDGADFITQIEPPCELVVEAKIVEESESGARISGTVSCGARQAASAEILLAAVDSLGDGARKVVFSKRFMETYDVLNVAKRSELSV